jgi:acyl carrier protein
MSGASATEIRDWCVAHVAQMLGRPAGEIDPDARFARLGLDSATMINLIVAAEEWLGIEIDPDSIYEHRTINALSGYLATLAGRAAGQGA